MLIKYIPCYKDSYAFFMLYNIDKLVQKSIKYIVSNLIKW